MPKLNSLRTYWKSCFQTAWPNELHKPQLPICWHTSSWLLFHNFTLVPTLMTPRGIISQAQMFFIALLSALKWHAAALTIISGKNITYGSCEFIKQKYTRDNHYRIGSHIEYTADIINTGKTSTILWWFIRRLYAIHLQVKSHAVSRGMPSRNSFNVFYLYKFLLSPGSNEKAARDTKHIVSAHHRW